MLPVFETHAVPPNFFRSKCLKYILHYAIKDRWAEIDYYNESTVIVIALTTGLLLFLKHG